MNIKHVLVLVVFCTASTLPAKADPICYMDMPDGSRLVLNGMCGREPVAPPKPGLTLDNFRRLQIDQTTYEQAVQILGGNGTLAASAGVSRSSESESYEWNQDGIKVRLTFSNKFGRLVLSEKVQTGLQPDNKEIIFKSI